MLSIMMLEDGRREEEVGKGYEEDGMEDGGLKNEVGKLYEEELMKKGREKMEVRVKKRGEEGKLEEV